MLLQLHCLPDTASEPALATSSRRRVDADSRLRESPRLFRSIRFLKLRGTGFHRCAGASVDPSGGGPILLEPIRENVAVWTRLLSIPAHRSTFVWRFLDRQVTQLALCPLLYGSGRRRGSRELISVVRVERSGTNAFFYLWDCLRAHFFFVVAAVYQ